MLKRSVLGVDLGLSWNSMGSAVVSFDSTGWTECTLGAVTWPTSVCNPAAIVNAIVTFALQNNICAISLDGPQGWRDPARPGTFVGRDCERLTRTPGKTGTFGVAIPSTWLRWIQCSVEVFDLLLATKCAMLVNGHENLASHLSFDRKFFVLECFPTSTWRRACLTPLPGHHIDLLTVQGFAKELRDAFALPEPTIPSGARDYTTHDNVQALVAALPAAALMGGPCRFISNGLPARLIITSAGIPAHRGEGIIWDAMPVSDLPRTMLRETICTKPNLHLVSTAERIPHTLMPDERGLERGVRLFGYLTDAANRGEAVGISYSEFIAYLHNVDEFREAAGRNYVPSDSKTLIGVAHSITSAAGGRREVARSRNALRAGMDTFIWKTKSPFDRPVGAWLNPSSTIPYTRNQWLLVFPHGARRLLTKAELHRL